MSMRLCLVATTYPSTTETFVYESVRWIERAGHEVHVVADQPGSVPGASLDEYPATIRGPWLGRGEKLARMAAFPLHTIIGGPRARRLQGSSTFTVAESVARSTFSQIRRADFVLAHFGPAGAQWLPVVAAARRPYAVFVHGYDATSYVRRLPRAYDALIASGTAMLTNSEYLKGRIAELGFDRARIGVVPLGVSDELSSCAARPDWSRRRILTIARLVSKKGLDDSIQAFALAQDRLCGRWRYQIVGDGELRAELEALSRSLGVDRLIEFSGVRSRADTIGALAEASVFVLASRTGDAGDTEGTPVSILEAGTLGLPIVTTRHAGIPELLPPSAEAEGMMVAERDVNGLADALRALATDEERWRRWGEACGTFIRSRHSASAHVQALLAALGRLAEVPR
jgi:colanic acid/amylovoran biosynthesis glycosyltransferase